jgi:hypothetical protein
LPNAWFTVAGRNSNQFAGGVIAVNWFANYKTTEKRDKFKFPQGGKFN